MPKDVAWQGNIVHTGVFKSPVAGRRRVGPFVIGRLACTNKLILWRQTMRRQEAAAPPRRMTFPGPHPSDPIWGPLSADQRQILLPALSRLLVRRLPAASDAQAA